VHILSINKYSWTNGNYKITTLKDVMPHILLKPAIINMHMHTHTHTHTHTLLFIENTHESVKNYMAH
jgi:hypothetical protein